MKINKKYELKDKIIFMTGASSGLGKISALKAANEGANIIALVRNPNKGLELIYDYKQKFPEGLGKIETVAGNLNSFESLKNACLEVSEKYSVIDMIVNNAGIMNFEFKESIDGIEETLQVNLISPLLICHLLYDNLVKSKFGKIIFTASGLHQGEINFDNLEFHNGFSSYKVYRQSKLGVILACRLLAEKLEVHNVNIYSQHPGMVRTELGRSAGMFSKLIFWLMGKSPEKGSETLSYLMDCPNEDLKSGEYYAANKITKTTPQAYDMEVAKSLLTVANEYLKNYIKNSSPIFKSIA